MGKFRDIKKSLKKLGATDEIIDYVKTQIKIKDNIIEDKKKLLEILNKKCCSIKNRYIDIESHDRSATRITINPCTGRITLKISIRSSPKVKADCLKICHIIRADTTLEPMTLRGKVHFKNNKYYICMQSDSKRFTKHYEMEI